MGCVYGAFVLERGVTGFIVYRYLDMRHGIRQSDVYIHAQQYAHKCFESQSGEFIRLIRLNLRRFALSCWHSASRRLTVLPKLCILALGMRSSTGILLPLAKGPASFCWAIVLPLRFCFLLLGFCVILR
jgi:hypothetical protein